MGKKNVSVIGWQLPLWLYSASTFRGWGLAPATLCNPDCQKKQVSKISKCKDGFCIYNFSVAEIDEGAFQFLMTFVRSEKIGQAVLEWNVSFSTVSEARTGYNASSVWMFQECSTGTSPHWGSRGTSWKDCRPFPVSRCYLLPPSCVS